MSAAESRGRVWFSAIRVRTLPAAVAPVLVGSALAARDHAFQPMVAGLCLGFALLIQIGTNFANDYFDFRKGADGPTRLGPRRVVAAGRVAPAVMRRAMLGVFAAAFLLGLGLLPWGGPPLLAIGVASVVCGLAYTGGPWPLGYHGLGDLFVFLFFGLVAVVTTHAVQAGAGVIELSLQLYFAAADPATPRWARLAIIAALGYFVSPIDAVPDLIPGIGYVDDLGVLTAAVATVATSITPEHRTKAREKMKAFFGRDDDRVG